MQVEQVVGVLDDPESAAAWLRPLGVENITRAHANLTSIAGQGLPLDLITNIFQQLLQNLGKTSDPEMALNNLDRYFAASRNPLSLASLCERDEDALPILLQIFSTSQYLSDLLVVDPEAFDVIRMTDGQPVARKVLVEELTGNIANLKDETLLLAVMRRYKRRETLRIAYGDIVRGQRIDVVTRQISFLADAICEAALQFARRKLEGERGVPRRPDGEPARFVILAMGKLGGRELNYSSDIDLIYLYDKDGNTDGSRSTSNHEFFDRLARLVTKYLSEPTELGVPYRVDLRLRPNGRQGPMVQSLESALHYYDVQGRTWERQAFVKARPISGDLDLGREMLEHLEPWIYRRYLSLADITGIKALKRRIEHHAEREGGELTNVKTGHGGIRDIEFAIQFLQLLNGGDLPELRTGNTLEAIVSLEQVGCLNMQERSILEESYSFLRKIEHRLQIMFDLQTHTLPSSDEVDEWQKLAIRMGYAGTAKLTALEAFRHEFTRKTNINRQILDHLLHDAFGDDAETEPEVDLVLDPNPSDEFISEVLARYGFQDISHAYQNLMALSVEKVQFLSTRRCRHFLASIAPRLLPAIAETPDPDATLVSLSKVSDSLGGKGVLWELFSFNPPSLNLYVRLCASSPYLSDILTSSPGMIDELMDSLMLSKLPSLETLNLILGELCRGAEDIDPIIHSFKKSQHLRVGVRDILGKADVQQTHPVLADVAEVCLSQITQAEYLRLVSKYGEPTVGEGPRAGEPCELMILAMGKMGGREPNYHSDLDIVFIYDSEGTTQHIGRVRKNNTTSNQHFFGQLGQRIIKVVNHMGPFGRLYEIDARLRPTGRSGPLAISLEEFSRYYSSGQGQLWERQALCKARPIFGSDTAREKLAEVTREAISSHSWQPANAKEIRDMRTRLEKGASKTNLKRGPGGTVDVEFLVQMLQLRHVNEAPEVLQPGTLTALAALNKAGHLSADDYEFFDQSYRYLRRIEARLRLMNTTARHDLPSDEQELTKLAYLLGQKDGQVVSRTALEYMAENRVRFERVFST